MITKYFDKSFSELKDLLLKLEVKLQSLSDEKNEYLRDIEDFNLQYNLYLGELIENILRLKKNIIYKKSKNTQSTNNQESYEETKEVITQIQEALIKLDNSLNIIDKNDKKYEETFRLYKELQEELKRYNSQLDSLESLMYSFDDIEDYQSQYNSAKQKYQEYYEEYLQIKDDNEKISLNKAEKIALKSIWKKACKLCHPDIVSDELREKAHEIMQLLNEAYSSKNIDKVKSILKDLENGNIFKIDKEEVNDVELIKLKIEEYQNKIIKLQLDINNIKNNETFKTISNEVNWNKYLKQIKENLEKEKESLEKEIKNLIIKDNEKFDLYFFVEMIKKIKNKKEFESYLEGYFFEIESFFYFKEKNDIEELEFDFKNILYILKSNNIISSKNSKIINAFLILLSQQFENANLIESMLLISEFLPESGIKKRIKASILYLQPYDLPTDYFTNFDSIISLLIDSVNEDENNKMAENRLYGYYFTGYDYFIQINNKNLLNQFNNMFIDNYERYCSLITNDYFYQKILIKTRDEAKLSISIKELLLKNEIKKDLCHHSEEIIITKENSTYSTEIYFLKNPTFKDIQQICTQYIKAIGNPQELYDRLNRGTVIIDDEKLLYKYITSFGAKHKTKLYDAFEVIKDKLDNQTINIVDWGCGQAFATMILLDFIKEKGVNLKISDICLIEPSKLALERGLLHVDVFKQGEYKIKAINSDLDCIKEDDISFDNDNKILHIFSNILDLESFKLNTDFLQKISKNINSDNMFVCVSPNINDKRNSRLDLFYNHFDENFNTELISSRSDDIFGNTRYEKIFEVIYAKPQEVTQSREEVKEYSLDIYSKLEKYTQIIEPILDSSKVKENIEKDPDYVIFKIRKVTEVITSKIYGKYEANENRISQNDKIRYLKFEKIINRKIESHLHTIRTIGNIGAHEHIENPIEMLTEDAYFLTTALILLIEELLKQKIIVLDN